MKARFISNVSNARLLRNRIDKGEGFKTEYVIERVIYLSKREFIPFRERLLKMSQILPCIKMICLLMKTTLGIFLCFAVSSATS